MQEARTSQMSSPGAYVQAYESNLCNGLQFADLCIYTEHNILQFSPKTQSATPLKNTGLKNNLKINYDPLQYFYGCCCSHVMLTTKFSRLAQLNVQISAWWDFEKHLGRIIYCKRAHLTFTGISGNETSTLFRPLETSMSYSISGNLCTLKNCCNYLIEGK